MNILHLSTPTTWRGGEQQVYWLFEEIQLQTSFQQHIVCPAQSVLHQKSKANNWQYETLVKAHHFNPFTIRSLVKIAKTHQTDIIHLHDAHALNIGVLAHVLFGLNIPLVFTRRVDFKLRNNYFTSFKYNHFAVKKIICVSNKIKQIISPNIKEKNRLTTIHSGIDTKRFVTQKSNSLRQELSIPNDTLLIGNVAALSDHKDLLTFVEVANIVVQKAKQKVHFLLIGEGKERAKIENKIRELGISKHITLTGFRTDITKILPQLSIFLMTSKEEGLGTSVLDAMAAGVPIVSTNAGGLSESVIHQKTGLLANVKDVVQLSNYTLQLLENQDLCGNLARQAQSFVKQNFSKQKMASEVLAVYEEVLKSN